MTVQAQVLILSGDGINCERETANAFNLAGANSKIVHINDLLENPKILDQFQALAFPGGFSFGDDLGSGQVLSIKIRCKIEEELKRFVEHQRPIIGICNGFQALIKLGLLPRPFAERTASLAHNTSQKFIDRWVDLELDEKSKCIWTSSIKSEKSISLPVRHGEGRVSFLKGNEDAIHTELSRNGQIPLRYSDNVNGSFGRIAGICDPKGLIFGLMPHPEAAISKLLYPQSSTLEQRNLPGVGLEFFKNCVQYLKEN